MGENQKGISAFWTTRTDNADFYDGPPGRRTNREGPEWDGVSKQDKLVRMAMMVMTTDNIPSIKLMGIDISKWKRERIDTHKKRQKGIENGAPEYSKCYTSSQTCAYDAYYCKRMSHCI